MDRPDRIHQLIIPRTGSNRPAQIEKTGNIGTVNIVNSNSSQTSDHAYFRQSSSSSGNYTATVRHIPYNLTTNISHRTPEFTYTPTSSRQLQASAKSTSSVPTNVAVPRLEFAAQSPATVANATDSRIRQMANTEKPEANFSLMKPGNIKKPKKGTYGEKFRERCVEIMGYSKKSRGEIAIDLAIELGVLNDNPTSEEEKLDVNSELIAMYRSLHADNRIRLSRPDLNQAAIKSITGVTIYSASQYAEKYQFIYPKHIIKATSPGRQNKPLATNELPWFVTREMEQRYSNKNWSKDYRDIKKSNNKNNNYNAILLGLRKEYLRAKISSYKEYVETQNEILGMHYLMRSKHHLPQYLLFPEAKELIENYSEWDEKYSALIKKATLVPALIEKLTEREFSRACDAQFKYLSTIQPKRRALITYTEVVVSQLLKFLNIEPSMIDDRSMTCIKRYIPIVVDFFPDAHLSQEELLAALEKLRLRKITPSLNPDGSLPSQFMTIADELLNKKEKMRHHLKLMLICIEKSNHGISSRDLISLLMQGRYELKTEIKNLLVILAKHNIIEEKIGQEENHFFPVKGITQAFLSLVNARLKGMQPVTHQK